MPVRQRNLAPGLGQRIVPAVVRVVVRGQREVLGRIRPDTIDAFVDLAGLGPGRYNLRVQVDPSEEVGVGDVTPTVVSSDYQMSVKKLFGTDGVRGKAGDYPLDYPTVARLGAALVRAMRPSIEGKKESVRCGSWSAATRASRARGSKRSWRAARARKARA